VQFEAFWKIYCTQQSIDSMSNPYKLIQVSEENHKLTITLDRPEKRNAFTPNMIDEIAFALRESAENKDIWAVLFKANGSVFSAGMDLKVFKNPELETPNSDFSRIDISLGQLVSEIKKPTVAIINAPVYAGGFLIIAECNFVLATQNATFTLPEVKRGIFPFQVMKSLSKSMTERKLIEWCALGKTYSATEAMRDGLVTQIIEESEVQNSENEFFDSLFLGSPLAIAQGIAAAKKLSSTPETEIYTYLKDTLGALKCSNDAAEGINAFVEKRTPKWSNS
jgi:methylglutaconyl-CoA hydratase